MTVCPACGKAHSHQSFLGYCNRCLLTDYPTGTPRAAQAQRPPRRPAAPARAARWVRCEERLQAALTAALDTEVPAVINAVAEALTALERAEAAERPPPAGTS